MSTRLFVGGLAWGTTDDSLKNFFAQIGAVVSATVIIDKFTNKSKGYGFVEMETPELATEAVEKLNGQELDGRTINVSEARPREERSNGGGGDRPRRFDDRRGGGDRAPRRDYNN